MVALLGAFLIGSSSMMTAVDARSPPMPCWAVTVVTKSRGRRRRRRAVVVATIEKCFCSENILRREMRSGLGLIILV